jgi:hypothetical protein
MDELKIRTPASFAEEIEDLIWKYDISYIDAVILFCEENDLEVETAASLIKLNANFKIKVQAEAEDLKYLPKIARLPI